MAKVSQEWLSKYQTQPAMQQPIKERLGGVLGSVAEVGIGAGAEAYRVAANMLSGVLSASDYINPVSWVQKLAGQKTFGKTTGQAIEKAGEQISSGIGGAYKGAGIDIETGYGKLGKGITDVASTMVAGGAAGGAIKGLGLAGKIATGAKFAGESMAATSTIVKGVQNEEVTAKKLAKGMAIDMATLGAFKLIGYALKAPGKYIYSKAFKEGVKEAKRHVAYGTETMAEEALRRGDWGTSMSLMNTAKRGLDYWDDGLESVLKQADDIAAKNINPNARAIIKRNDLVKGLLEMADDAAIGDRTSAITAIQNVIDEMPVNMTMVQANKAKRALYQAAKQVYGIDVNAAFKKEIQAKLAKNIKEVIETKASKLAFDGLNIKAINQELRYFGKLDKMTVNALAKAQEAAGMNLVDMASMGAGGLAFGGVGLPAGVIAKKIVSTTIFKTAFGKMLYNAGKFPETLAGKQANNLITFLIKKALMTGEPNELVSEKQLTELQSLGNPQTSGYITRPPDENLTTNPIKYNLRRGF